MHRFRAIFVAGAIVAAASFAATTVVADAPAAPDFGANVHIFNPGMGQATIQAQLNAIAAAQVNNEFGPRRDAVLFEPGTYGTKSNPLNFQVGYYTEVAGLGLSPDDVVINGSIDVFDRCLGANGTNCLALVNFWRSMSNLELNVVTPRGGCRFGEFWAVSQAAPMRRVHVNGFATLMDYCLQPAFASGGFIADSEFDGSTVVNGSQQQWVTRNSKLDGWTNAVWNPELSPPDLHDARDQSGDPGSAISLPRLDGQLQRVRAVRAVQHARNHMGVGPDARHLHIDRPVLRGPADRFGGDHESRTSPRQESHPDPRRVPPGPEHRRDTARLGRARSRVSNPRARQRSRLNERRTGAGDDDLGDHLRRGHDELARPAAGWQRTRTKRQRGN